MGYKFPYKNFLASQIEFSNQIKVLLAIGLMLPIQKANKNNSTHLSHQTYQRFPHRANYFFEANKPPKAKNLTMDLSKLNIDTLDGSNWGTWSAQVQSATRILNCWNVIKGEVVVPVTTPPMYQLLTRPTAATQTNAALLVEELAAWTKKNSTALGVIQGKTSPAIWPNFVNHTEAATLWAALETKYGEAGGPLPISK